MVSDFRGRSKGFAYVDFDSPSSARSASGVMHGYSLNQRPMKALPSKPTKSIYEEKTLFLSGISQELQGEKEVEEALKSLGFQDITGVRLIRGHNSKTGETKREKTKIKARHSSANGEGDEEEQDVDLDEGREAKDKEKEERSAGCVSPHSRDSSRRTVAAQEEEEDEKDVSMQGEEKKVREDAGTRAREAEGIRDPKRNKKGDDKNEDVVMAGSIGDDAKESAQEEGVESKHKG